MLEQLSWKVMFSALKIYLLAEFWAYKHGTRFILKRNEVSIQMYP